MARGAWWSTVHGVEKSRSTEWLTLLLFQGINYMKGAGRLLKYDDLKIINYFCLPLHIAVNFYNAERFLISSQFYREVIEDRSCLAALFFLYSFKNIFSSPIFLSLYESDMFTYWYWYLLWYQYFPKKIFFFHSLAPCLEASKTTPKFDDSWTGLTALSILSHFWF